MTTTHAKEVDRRHAHRATIACGRWLASCLRDGWKREQLDDLEKIWWEYHDDNGNLIERARLSKGVTGEGE